MSALSERKVAWLPFNGGPTGVSIDVIEDPDGIKVVRYTDEHGHEWFYPSFGEALSAALNNLGWGLRVVSSVDG